MLRQKLLEGIIEGAAEGVVKVRHPLSIFLQISLSHSGLCDLSYSSCNGFLGNVERCRLLISFGFFRQIRVGWLYISEPRRVSELWVTR